MEGRGVEACGVVGVGDGEVRGEVLAAGVVVAQGDAAGRRYGGLDASGAIGGVVRLLVDGSVPGV